MQSINKTFIIIVNYNSWKDTLICLEDLKQKYWENFEVVLVDNCSTDNSAESIENYISGHDLSFIKEKSTNQNLPIHFLKSDFNKGFASGNNIGIEFAQSKYDKPFYIWMLNNDTVVENNSLPNLISFFESDNYGLIGSKILDFDPPHEIQSLYGTFNKFTGRAKTIRNLNSKKQISYPIGASLFLTSEIINNLGGLNEEYFLYHEEIDYSLRVLKNNLKIGVCLDSIVFHKQGASTGSFKNKKKKNLHIEEYKYNGLLLLYKNYFRRFIIIAYANLIIKAFKFSFKGEFANARLIFKVISKR
tara:strand:- start:8743 stop:9651 length:909 start_codon:yes stop_codon:yes gene_type:complete